MIEYCEPIKLTNWNKIKDLYKDTPDRIDSGEYIFSNNSEDIAVIDALLKSDIIEYTGNKNIKVDKIYLFCIPNLKLTNHPIIINNDRVDVVEQMNIHVDDAVVKYALNIPIINCEHSTMYWYNKEQIQKDDMFISGRLKINDDIKVMHSKVIDTPHIVRVDKPHNSINSGHGMRVLLSVRFDPDLF